MKLFKKFLRTKKKLERNQRIKIIPLHSISLVIKDHEYKVSNISYSGIGVLLPLTAEHFQAGQEVSATVLINDKSAGVTLQIIHCGKQVLGMKVTSLASIYERYIREYFTVELKAFDVRRIKPEALKKLEKGEPHWYCGGESQDLYFITEDENIIYFQLNYQDYIFQMNFDQHVIAGHIAEEDYKGLRYKGSQIINNEKKISPQMFDHMLRFLNVVTSLPSEYKKFILSRIEQKYSEKI